MDIKFFTAGQGLIKMEINNKPSDWAISNNGGKWQLYKMHTDISIAEDLAPVIHNDKELAKRVAQYIQEATDGNVFMAYNR